MHSITAWYTWKSEEVTGSPRIRVADTCEPWYVCWESNPGSLKDQQELLTTEPSA